MQAFQQRVVDEKQELDGKLGKLDTFILSDLFRNLPMLEQERMKRQQLHMSEYSKVLSERIEAFK